jgi:biopolymer transport protein ExbD
MQFKSMATLNITLPKVETAGKNEFKGTVTIGIDNKGLVSFNGKDVSDEQLLVLLKQVHDVDKDIPVLIKADETTQLKKLAFVMDSCRKTGLNKFSLQSR